MWPWPRQWRPITGIYRREATLSGKVKPLFGKDFIAFQGFFAKGRGYIWVSYFPESMYWRVTKVARFKNAITVVRCKIYYTIKYFILQVLNFAMRQMNLDSCDWQYGQVNWYWCILFICNHVCKLHCLFIYYIIYSVFISK